MAADLHLSILKARRNRQWKIRAEALATIKGNRIDVKELFLTVMLIRPVMCKFAIRSNLHNIRIKRTEQRSIRNFLSCIQVFINF